MRRLSTGERRAWTAALATCAAGLTASGCFLTQAAIGHLDLQAQAEPIERLLRRGVVPARLGELLGQRREISAFAARHGLAATEHYQSYAELEREAAVWVVTACEPLRFRLKTWSFPLVGSFPYLGFFDPADATRYAAELADDGWDVHVRGAAAYSTLGWFSDPLLSTMLTRGPATVGDFVNTVLHESVHATLHLHDQGYFNESIALFVADGLTPLYLAERYGAGSAALRGYLAVEARRAERGATLQRTYQALAALYDAPLDDAAKRQQKTALLAALQAELGSAAPPNNAMLEGYRSYRVGQAGLARLLAACGGEHRRLLGALSTLAPSDFNAPHLAELDPLFDRLTRAGCPAAR